MNDWICIFRNLSKSACVLLVGKNMHRRICAEKSDLSIERLDQNLWNSLLAFMVVLLLQVNLADANCTAVSILNNFIRSDHS